MPKIWRVEKETKVREKLKFLGPYWSGDSSVYDLDLYDKIKHPGPTEYVSPKHIFGFASLEDLQNWFSLETRIKLKLVDFLVGVYFPLKKNVVYMDKQVVFPYDSRRIKSIDILNFA